MASLFRKEIYREFKKHQLGGNILDVGGNKDANYQKLFGGENKFTSINISGDCDYKVDVEKIRWPFKDEQFDFVLMINILEHLYNYNFALKEAKRVLKNGGLIICVVPFFLNLHASPNDYFRFTRQSLNKILEDAQFSNISIQEVGRGFFAVHYYLWQRFLPSFFDFLIFIQSIRTSLLKNQRY